ncbi:MAG: ABC transporter ATP-binding protein [Clostridia bacterium]|nr:ABC transporter ATP-binding protein [Clostridia bacterium]
MKVTLQNLTKQFPSRSKKEKQPVTALYDFTLEIPDGSLVGLLGPSGCGKSTTLNLISGLLKPTSGNIFFGNEDVTNVPAENRGIGLVFQNYALYPHLTVLKNILFPLENLKGKDKLSKQEMLEKASQAAKLVQIESLMDRKPNELSGGQQQRVAIARALVKMPRVLLLDEPLSNLDARLRLATREEIKRIQQETKITTVFVTHDQDEAMSICDFIVVMREGKLEQVGKPQEIYDNPENLFVAKFLGTPAINVFDGIVKDEKLYIGSDFIFDVPGVVDTTVKVGIRPEGFILSENGHLSCNFCGVEVMGRDISIISTNENSENKKIRSIISSENKVDTSSSIVRFDLKPSKVFIFHGDTHKRIHFSVN